MRRHEVIGRGFRIVQTVRWNDHYPDHGFSGAAKLEDSSKIRGLAIRHASRQLN